MKIKQLRDQLVDLDRRHDDKDVTIWLPGSRIDLCNSLMMVREGDGEIMIEGNVRRGSALDAEG